jgi:hypothetical protein
MIKAGLPPSCHALPLTTITDKLRQAYKTYYEHKRDHLSLRESALSDLAEAMAQEGTVT